MLDKYICKNILGTPIGNIYVCDKNNELIDIDIKVNSFSPSYEVFNCENISTILNIESNYIVEILTKNLIKGEYYQIKYDGGALKLNAGDEHTVSITGTYKGYSLGISAFDPNDEEIIEQSIAYSKEIGVYNQNIIEMPPDFDESKFIEYTVDLLDDKTGFRFKLLDETVEVIKFKVAWIKNSDKYIDIVEYEDAIDFWIS